MSKHERLHLVLKQTLHVLIFHFDSVTERAEIEGQYNYEVLIFNRVNEKAYPILHVTYTFESILILEKLFFNE